MKVLVVDDSETVRMMVMRYAESLGGIEFLEASNGNDALTILQEEFHDGSPIDVIFLDWMMPKMTGFDLLKNIREVAAFLNFPRIIMLSAETYSEQIRACVEFKISRYLTKPFKQEEVVEALEEIIKEIEVSRGH